LRGDAGDRRAVQGRGPLEGKIAAERLATMVRLTPTPLTRRYGPRQVEIDDLVADREGLPHGAAVVLMATENWPPSVTPEIVAETVPRVRRPAPRCHQQ